MDPYEKDDCEREKSILQHADNPFIISYIEEFMYDQTNLCIVTKYAACGDLEKYIAKNKQLSEE